MRIARSTFSSLFVSLLTVFAPSVTALGIPQDFSLDRAKITPVPVKSGTVKIAPNNTLIEFIGTHVGAETKPRLGGFKDFHGEIKVDTESITSLAVELNIGSIWTEFSGLTRHLQAPDFLDTKSFGKAKFVSTSIVPGNSEGEVNITGNLTIHGTTNEISIPGKLELSSAGIVLISLFKVDRTAFAMNEHKDGVDTAVSVNVVVGQKNEPKKEDGPNNDLTGNRQQEKKEQPAPESGLRIGDLVEPWTPVHVAGPDKGKKACPICTYPEHPAVVIFANDGEATTKLLSEMEGFLAEPEQKELKIFFVIIDADEPRLNEIASAASISRTALCHLTPMSAKKVLADYKVDPSKANTVMVYRNFKVNANFNNLDATDLAKFKNAVAEVLE